MLSSRHLRPSVFAVVFSLFLAFIFMLAHKAPLTAERMPAADAYAVLDMAGQPIYMRQTTQKGLVFAPVADHFITVDNSDSHIIALAEYIRREASQTMMGKIFPALPYKEEALTTGVTQPLGVEQTLLLNPDVVVLYNYQTAPFDAVSFTGLARITNIRVQEKEMFGMLGGLTGQTQRVEDLFARREIILNEIFAAIPQDKPPVKMLTMSHSSFSFFTTLFENYNDYIKRCNAVNLTEKALPGGDTNLEHLLKLNPEVIFLYDYRNQLTVQDVFSNRALAGLSAVKNRRVYRMPKGVARMTGPLEEPLLIAWMCQLLHPEMTPATSFRWLIKSAYHEVFDYWPTEADVDDFLNMLENVSSAYYYEKFQYHATNGGEKP